MEEVSQALQSFPFIFICTKIWWLQISTLSPCISYISPLIPEKKCKQHILSPRKKKNIFCKYFSKALLIISKYFMSKKKWKTIHRTDRRIQILLISKKLWTHNNLLPTVCYKLMWYSQYLPLNLFHIQVYSIFTRSSAAT